MHYYDNENTGVPTTGKPVPTLTPEDAVCDQNLVAHSNEQTHVRAFTFKV